MSNRNLWVVVAAVAILSVVASIAIKSCVDKGRPPVVSPTQPSIDSVAKNDAETKRIMDSLNRIVVVIKSEKDSLHRVTEKQSDLIDLRTQQVITWKKQYELARKYADTPTSLASCDSLVAQVDSLLVQITQRERSTQYLQNSYDSLLSNTSLRISRLEFDNSFLKEKFDLVAGNGKDLEKESAKWKRKAGKRWGLGAHITATYLDGKIVPAPGFGIHYSLIRF